ncbi:MAG: hypothetical protein DHS20C11_19380 [Lysobacteraceae bacterium]|nr:MAG: hypothetical protein DHS20C11_19380 [Xanthomonadaceae bacterium]
MKLDKDHYKTAVYPSPFHAKTSVLNETREFERWHDYMSATRYFDVSMEYFSCRNSTGVFDLTAMCKYRITGVDALDYLNRLMTRDVSKIKVGRVGYGVWCDDAGQVVDDGTVFHIRDGEYWLCAQGRQYDWLLTSALGFDVVIEDISHQMTSLAVQGPTSCATLKAMGLAEIETLKPFGLRHYSIEDGELTVSRTGFTGDLGYELWMKPELAEPVWDALFAAGRLHGIKPMGERALAMARLEAGFIQAWHDFLPADKAVRTTHTRSPFELDLHWLVDFKKPNFTGRRALLEEKRNGSRYRLARLDIDGNKPAHHAFVYNRQNKVIGIVTSAMWSPSAKANIALASLDVPYGEPGDEYLVEIYYQRELAWNRVMAPCRVVKGAFFDPPRKKQTPPADC